MVDTTFLLCPELLELSTPPSTWWGGEDLSPLSVRPNVAFAGVGQLGISSSLRAKQSSTVRLQSGSQASVPQRETLSCRVICNVDRYHSLPGYSSHQSRSPLLCGRFGSGTHWKELAKFQQPFFFPGQNQI